MTCGRWVLRSAGLDDMQRLAELIALKVRAGDIIALRGNLGAGKTTFARALLRVLLGDPEAEIPSPTFPLVQTYATPRIGVWHYDLYRLQGEEDLVEIGLPDDSARGLALVEWPERAGDALGDDRLDLLIEPGPTSELRLVTLDGHRSWLPRVTRLESIDGFLTRSLGAAHPRQITYLQGDASPRAYARVGGGPEPLVLMDAPRMPDGPPVRNGLPYSRIAHLAEDVRPFVAIGRALAEAGLSVPRIVAHDIDAGLLLLEDLGDLTFGRALGLGHDQRQLWLAAVDTLAALRRKPPPSMALPDGTPYRLPRFDRAALEIELDLILDWYWPAAKGGQAPQAVRESFQDLWRPVLDRMLAAPAGLFLRDYHSPNLFWLPDREGARQVGIIDFQDSLAEPWAYDMVSLLQDARVDVPEALEQEGRERYMAAVSMFEPDFDRGAFLAAYAAFGAQRNTRLIGLWVRLDKRDGKPHYMAHMARTSEYLARNLAHPDLADLRVWYEQHLPEIVKKPGQAR
jgi:N-acetylmuramate 1-kinase